MSNIPKKVALTLYWIAAIWTIGVAAIGRVWHFSHPEYTEMELFRLMLPWLLFAVPMLLVAWLVETLGGN